MYGMNRRPVDWARASKNAVLATPGMPSDSGTTPTCPAISGAQLVWDMVILLRVKTEDFPALHSDRSQAAGVKRRRNKSQKAAESGNQANTPS